MKTKLAIIAAMAVSTLALHSQPAGLLSQRPKPEEKRTYAVSDRGAHHRVWSRVEAETSVFGRVSYRTNIYTELATGMHFKRDGQWHETKAEIELLEDGAAATNGPHKVFFAQNINTMGAVDMTTPDGKRLRSRILGLSYFDGSNAVLIAAITNSMGLLVGNNQVFYTNAFDDVDADVQYVYNRGGFQQNIILRNQPPDPAQFGLNPETTRLQVLTEFFDPPTPQKQTLPAKRSGDLPDEMLNFGEMKIGRGKAFAIGEDRLPGRSLQITKSWVNVNARTILIEEVPFKKVENKVSTLPGKKRSAYLKPKPQGKGNDVRMALKNVLPSQMKTASRSGSIVKMAKASEPEKPGFVLDYEILSSDTNFTFRGDMTYLVSEAVNLYGTTTIEGGTIVKHDSNPESYPTILLWGPVRCQTGPYRPAIFTSSDDDSVGETIDGSSGIPTVNGTFLLDVEGPTSEPAWEFQYLRMSYGLGGVFAYDNRDLIVRNSQFINNSYASGVFFADLKYENVLFSSNDVVIYASGAVECKNVTVDDFSIFCTSIDGFPSLVLTNCLIIGTGVWTNYEYSPGSLPTAVLDHSVHLTSGSGVFQTAGGGSYYLADESPYRNAGNALINEELLSSLRRTTTYPPIVFSDETLTAYTTLAPQAQRDTDAPDLGYHYDPLDYLFGGCTVDADLTFPAGTAVGFYRLDSDWYHAGHGIRIADNRTLNFNGRVDSPCYFAHQTAVQEQLIGYSPISAGPGAITSWAESYEDISDLKMRFTRFSGLPPYRNYFRDDWGVFRATANDCEFYSGGVGGYTMVFGATNCLMDRANVWLEGGNAYYFAVRNCTFFGGSLAINRWSASVVVTVLDSAFERTYFNGPDAASSDPDWTHYDYNAYITNTLTTDPPGANDFTVTNFNWQTSWLGRFYLPTNSLLIDAGSLGDSTLIGLGHYTSTTDQAKEEDSQLNIGYHYVAVDESGIPLDYDGDGVPDYWEDRNGDGVVDSGETHWYDPLDWGLKVIITKPKKNSTVP